jgi:Uma2 family endonuclease
MQAVVTTEQIELSPGALVRLPGDWTDYQLLLEKRGDHSLPRIKFRPGEILFISPMPQHGRDANGLADVVKVLLEHLGCDYVAFTPITLALPETSGVEPDYCFYIENHTAITGKDQITWGVDPAPDLVIEMDVTSFTDIADYAPYQVPEVWLWKQQQLLIYHWSSNGYQLQPISRYCPRLNVAQLTADYLQIARNQSTSAALRNLRQQLAQEAI